MKPRPPDGTALPIDREETLKKAENFLRQGRLDQAIAEYERVVEDQPRDWTTVNALGDLYLRANETERAVTLYQKIAAHMFSEGFYPKAAALYRKILKLAPADEKVLLNLAEISAKQGLLADARVHFAAIAKRRREAGDSRGAEDIAIRLGSLDPNDVDARVRGARIVEARGDNATAAAHFREIYEYLLEKGRDAEATEILKDVARCDPADPAARTILANAAVSRGDFRDARNHLDRDSAGNDPELLFALINVELQAGRVEIAQELMPELFRLDPNRRFAIVDLGWSLLDSNIFAASACVEAGANALIEAGQYAEAASILQEFATRVPGQVNALLKLVEVCVDGGLESMMYEAQAQLADAYLSIGLASEARVIAEDLLSREPWESTHVDRLRRALELLKVPDVEAVVAQRLSAPPDEHISPVVRDETTGTREPTAQRRRLLSERPQAPVPELPRRRVQPPPQQPVPSPPQKRAPVEVDLTMVLGDLHESSPATSRQPGSPPPSSQELGHVFAGIRATVEDADGAAAEHLALGKTYVEMGKPEEAIPALEVAAKSPRHRFEAGGLLARLFRDAGEIARAIEWFERAAEAPPTSVDDGRALLYDLGSVLQQAKEHARALAVFLELQADAPGYLDVSKRVATLTRQTGG